MLIQRAFITRAFFFPSPHPTQPIHAYDAPLPPAINPNTTCYWTVVRDPLARALSGYNEVEYRMTGGGDAADGDRYVGALDASEAANGAMVHRGLEVGSEERVLGFVLDWVDG